MPLSDSSQTCARAVRPKPSPAVLRLTVAAGVSEVSRFSCMKFLGVPGAFDYAGPTRARAIAIVRVAFRTCLLRRRPGCIFSQLNLPPRLFPCLRFAVHLAMPNAKLGAKVDRYSFFVRLLPPLLHTGLARRTNIAISLIIPCGTGVNTKVKREVCRLSVLNRCDRRYPHLDFPWKNL